MRYNVRYRSIGFRAVRQLSTNNTVSLLIKMISRATSPSQTAAEEYRKVVAALGYLAPAIVQSRGIYLRDISRTGNRNQLDYDIGYKSTC